MSFWDSVYCSGLVVAFLLFIRAAVVSELEDKLYMMINQGFCSEMKKKTIDLHI